MDEAYVHGVMFTEWPNPIGNSTFCILGISCISAVSAHYEKAKSNGGMF